MKHIVMFLFPCFSILDINELAAIADEGAAASFERVLNKETPIDIILVSRNVPASEYSSIELDEIALIFACLAVSIHNDKKNIIKKKLETLIDNFSYNNDMPNLSSYLKSTNLAPNIKDARKRIITEKFDEYCKNLNLHLSEPDIWKIIIFNEMFFSKNTPLKSKEVEKISKLFFEFLDDDNALLHVNFLYTGRSRIETTKKDTMHENMDGTYTSEKFPRVLFVYNPNDPNGSFQVNSNIVTDYKKYINKLNDHDEYNVLFNMSFIFYKRERISYYSKSTYCFEANNLLFNSNWDVLENAYVYNIGTKKDLMIDDKYPKLSKLVVDNISSEICYDLTIGIRKENHWTNIGQESKIHVYSSNTSSQSRSKNFPQNKVTACVDPNGTVELNGSSDKALSLVFKNKAVFPQTANCFNYGTNYYSFISVKNVLSK